MTVALDALADRVFLSVKGYVSKVVAGVIERCQKIEARLDSLPQQLGVQPDTVRLMIAEEVEKRAIGSAEVAALVETSVARQLDLLRPHLKGEKGDPGEDGRDAEPATNGRDGKDGVDGFSPEDLDLEMKDERVLAVRLRVGVREVVREVKLPIPVDRGIWNKGQRYEKGDIVTYAGSAFIAQRDTYADLGLDKKGKVSPDWRLIVQRGRDAR